MNKILIVAKYEYLTAIKRPAFWFTTLFMPILMGILLFLSGYTSAQGEEKLLQISEDIQTIYIIDELNIIPEELLIDPLVKVSNLEASIDQVKAAEVDGLIYIPKDLLESNTIRVYTQNRGVFGDLGFSSLGQNLLYQTAVTYVDDAVFKHILINDIGEETILYDENGREVDAGLTRYIIPAVSAVVFFISVFLSAQFLLQSVSEEKENRMIETILSMIDSKTLISGKIIGLSSVVLTQLFTWIILGSVVTLTGVRYFDFNLDINFDQLQLLTLPLNLFFIFAGFLMFAAIMVGVGSVATSYKDSQSLSSVFIILSILPIYFITIIIAEPNGTISRIVSYFPLTSPMVFLIRNSITTLPIWELALGIFLIIVYVLIAFKIASRLFDLGALMYSRRPSIKEVIYILLKK